MFLGNSNWSKMVTRPLLYLSLPGLALIIGLIFYRRQKKSKEEKDNSSNDSAEEKIVKFNDENLKKMDESPKNEAAVSIKVTKNSKFENQNEYDNNFGKSAPINIAYGGGKSFAAKLNDNNMNSNDARYRHQLLSSLDKDVESYLSSVDLPDSPDKKRCSVAYDAKCSEQPIVVVKATVTPNVSLSNSFLENKYTEEAEINEPLTNHHLNSNNENLSPPTSEFSARSGDSGKGSSLPQSDRMKITNYDFILPISLIGQLYGRKRAYINQIKSKSGANIIVKSHDINKVKICSLKGTEKEINSALSLIRARFPLKRYPNLTLQKVEYAEPHAIVQLSLDYTSCLQLRLIEGINNDVIVVAAMSGNHIFVQHPSHPSFPSISVLQDFMNKSYETGEAPSLPELTENAICVAKVGEQSWFRVQIIVKDNKEQKCLVKFLDYGGYTVIGMEQLKQIRADFMSMPFQATECLLSNIEPIGTEWSQGAMETLCHLTTGLVLQAQIVRYNTATNLPEVNLYAPLSRNSVIFINKEMVARRHAKWTSATI